VVFLPVTARTYNTKALLVSLGVAWTLLVMISRIIVGAHFATDVLFGAFIPLFVFSCLSLLIKPTKSDS
jgi:membrane-associated phospholipid phosphatase